LSRNPSTLEQALQRWIEGSVVYQELMIGLLLKELRNPVSVVRSQRQAAQNQDLKRALQKLDTLR
jgi:hypothetical protein